ncbi:MAG: YqeG family HAD IIIA-type phosphatase [Lachnospiraceae bacterium]|nr:YqeG family HAD IIIA-type phosphatase [Parasporobacterium sp.]MBR4169896.1 YqeG family HAD IIIA-type phosphatase [Lachnospiraceae bacterium]
MFEIFYPDTCADNAYEIDYEGYYAAGYRGIIFDIDNTLVEHDAPATEAAVALFERLRSVGFQMLTLSNNTERRVKMFCDAVSCPYLYKAGKPKKDGYFKAMQLMGTDVGTTLFIGDQLFTDVWGANRAGIKTILVTPISKKERFQIVLKRIPERWILFFYHKRSRKP